MLRTTGRILVLALVVRLLSLGVAFLANVTFPEYQREQFTVARQADAFWDTFARYDSGWYQNIARNGYRFAEGGRSNLAFFPLYPLLMRHVGRLFGTRTFHYYLAGIVISWLAFLGAMALLYRLAVLDVSPEEAERAVWYAAIFPFAFFYGVVYTESLFLLLAVAAFYGFRTKRWWLGAVAGSLIGATRPNGVLIWPALALVAWNSAGEDRPSRWRAAAALLVVPVGFLAYGWYNYHLSGDWLEWYAALQRWGYEPGSHSFDVYIDLGRALATRPVAFLMGERNAPYDLLNASAAALALMAIPFVWRRFGSAYALFMGVNLYVPLSTGQFEGLGRYCTVLFPVFIWLSTLHSQTVQQTLLAGFAMLYVLCLAMFVNIHPIF